MIERREDLKDLQIEVLNKFCVALESIPLPVLEKFPKFDSDSFKKLQHLHRHVKAKLRLIHTKLSRLEKEEEIESPDALTSTSWKSAGTPTTCVSRNILSNDPVNLNMSSILRTLEFHQESLNVMESCTNSSFESTTLSKPPEIAGTIKKSTFQLKRPVKAVLSTDVSKTIEEMWEKDQQMSRTMNFSINSEHVPKNTFSNDIKSPSREKESNEKNSCMQSNIDSPDKWISIDKPHGKTINKYYIFPGYLKFLTNKYIFYRQLSNVFCKS